VLTERRFKKLRSDPGSGRNHYLSFFAPLASLAENKFKLSDCSGHDGKVVLKNEATNPALFSVFCVLSGKSWGV
jgi:hypothetical protein